MKRLLLVAGSGRSGTSVLAALVGQLGFHVPQPEVRPDETNPKGFGEPQWVVDFHTRLLRSANVQSSDARPVAWSDAAQECLHESNLEAVRDWLAPQFQEHEHIVVKDPRLLWFLPLWHRAGAACGATVDVVTMLRHPAEVVRSKSRWYAKMELAEANRLAGWVNTMLFTERGTRDRRRVFLAFDTLLDDWTQPIGRLSEELDLPVLVNARARDQAAADAFIDRSLHRSKASWTDLHAPKELVDLAQDVWADLSLLCDDVQDEAALQRLDKHRERFLSMYHDAEGMAESTALAAARPLQHDLARRRRSERAIRAQLLELEAENARLQREIAALKRSASAQQLAPPRADALLVRIARRIPPSMRHRLPHGLRRAVFDRYRP